MHRHHVYFDEDVPGELAGLLRRLGVTVHRPRNLGTLGADDPVHLQVSASRKWALITQNRQDFRRLHWLWMSLHRFGIIPQGHSGILTVYQQVGPQLRGAWARAIHDKLQDPSGLLGFMYIWKPSTGEWEDQPLQL